MTLACLDPVAVSCCRFALSLVHHSSVIFSLLGVYDSPAEHGEDGMIWYDFGDLLHATHQI